jgi:putative spermidine/putrescine transport system substrate-binding protein
MKLQTLARLGLAAAGVAALLFSSACSGGSDEASSSGKSQVVFAGWGGAFGDAMFKTAMTPWSEKTGVKVVDDAPFSFTKLRGMVDNGNVSWDMLMPGSLDTVKYCGSLLQSVDWSNLNKSDFLQGTPQKCGVPYDYSATVMVYNKKLFGDRPPTSLSDFFDLHKYPGKRLIPSSISENPLQFALIADGVSKHDLYPLDVNRALAKYDTIKDQLVFWSLGDEQVQQLEGENVAMGIVWAGRGQQAAANGAPYEAVWGTHVIDPTYLAIPTGAPHLNDAMKLIEYATSPEPQARFNEIIAYSAANLNAKPNLDEAHRAWDPVVTGSHHETAFDLNLDWLSANFDELQNKWVAWTSG